LERALIAIGLGLICGTVPEFAWRDERKPQKKKQTKQSSVAGILLEPVASKQEW